MTDPRPSIDDLAEHIRDLRTALQLRADLLEICLPTAGSPDTVARELVTLLCESIARGKADSEADQPGSAA